MQQHRARVRHVWVRSGFGGPPQQGLVLGWRRVPREASPPTWQALVLQVDEKTSTVRTEWVFVIYLVPVVSAPPGYEKS
ncbi:MAG: hypothetical protein NTV23_04470 [Propionibacteriales bacterium]|nr:hypothetical protein [Propionibacteriales bacterium]